MGVKFTGARHVNAGGGGGGGGGGLYLTCIMYCSYSTVLLYSLIIIHMNAFTDHERLFTAREIVFSDFGV